jgi:hypothetical protein
VFEIEAEGVLRSLWGAPCRIDREGVNPAGGCGAALVIGGVDHRSDMTEQAIDVGESLALQGCKYCDMSVVGEHIENDPRSYGTTIRLGLIWKGRYVRSQCVRLVCPGYPRGGGETGVVVEKVIESSVHRSEDTNNVAWSVWRGRHVS